MKGQAPEEAAVAQKIARTRASTLPRLTSIPLPPAAASRAGKSADQNDSPAHAITPSNPPTKHRAPKDPQTVRSAPLKPASGARIGDTLRTQHGPARSSRVALDIPVWRVAK